MILIFLPSSSRAMMYYQDNTCVYDFNINGDSFTNTSGWQNVTCGVGDRQGGLQLNYTTQDITIEIPSDGDNWTEFSGCQNWWSMSLIDNDFIGRGSAIPKVGSYYILISFFDNGTDGLIISLTLPSTINISNFEKLGFWVLYMDYYEIPTLEITDISIFEGADSISTKPHIILERFAVVWQYFSVSICDFSSNPSFNSSAVSKIEWKLDWYPRIYNRTLGEMILFDGVCFEKNETQYNFKNSGIWYSDWITLNGIGNKVTINSKYSIDINFYISSDNSTWYSLASSGTSDISQYNFQNKVILQVCLNKTNNNDSPIVDSIVVTSKISSQIPLIFMPSSLLDFIIAYGIVVGLAVIIGVETVLLIKKKGSRR